MILEVVGGFLSGSIAIMVDAAHMFSDVAGFMISFFAIYISKRKSTFNKSYGYHRSEVLGAMLSVFVIWGLLIWLNISAISRIITPPDEKINADIMLITACIGLACNIINFCALNCACGTDIEEDEPVGDFESEHDDWTVEMNSHQAPKKTHLALTQLLIGVYVPRQAHMCIMKFNNKSLSTSRVEREFDEENQKERKADKAQKQASLVTKDSLKYDIGMSTQGNNLDSIKEEMLTEGSDKKNNQQNASLDENLIAGDLEPDNEKREK
jgi:putative flippase GtrA